MTREPLPGRGPLPFALAGPILLLSPADAGLVVAALDRVARVDRIPLSPRAAALRAAAADVAVQAVRGPADVRRSPPEAPWPKDEIGTKEAGDVIGCSDKHVRRLAQEGRLGRTRVVRGRRLVSRAEVQAYADERNSS